MRFDFSTAPRILFGAGVLKEIRAIAPASGKKALVIYGQGGAVPETLLSFLDEVKVSVKTFTVGGEPTVELVQQACRAARESACDFVIGFGGGSVIDTGKAVAGMLTNSGDILDYLEVVGRNQSLLNPAAPYIAIPTTAGTGSEVTRNAVLAVPEHRFKVSMRSAYLLPRVALVDPELTYSLPPSVTASTGMDALTQVLEPFVSKRANAMTDLYCREGLQRSSSALYEAYRDGSNQGAREDMAWTSLLGGLSLANAGLGAVHGFAAPIGGMFDAPHGTVCACLLPAVVRINVRALHERDPGSFALQRYGEVARILTKNERATIQDGIHWLEQIRADLQIPGLAAFGITRQDFPILAEKAANASSMKANPVEFTTDELLEILDSSL